MNKSNDYELDTQIAQVSNLLEKIFPKPRNFDIRFWNQYTEKADQKPDFTLVLNHPGALKKMLAPPIELSMAEAYIYEDFDIEGDFYKAFNLINQFQGKKFSTGDIFNLIWRVIKLPESKIERSISRPPAELKGKVHSKNRDMQAIQFHYDVGNEFYQLWLDKHMQYSSGYFPNGDEELDIAQEKKLNLIAQKLQLSPGDHLLDIGCGWGGLAIYMAQKFDVTVLGVTLSKKQTFFAQEIINKLGLKEKVDIALRDYRDLESSTFDKIVSVGMFEHVGRTHLPEYYTHVFRLLKPGGLFLNQGIAQISETLDFDFNSKMTIVKSKNGKDGFFDRKLLGVGTFSQRYIFPDGELVPVSEANLIADASGFEVRDVQNLREHYALTLRQWVRRLMDHHKEAVDLVGETIYRTWKLYMAGSALQFERGEISTNQTLFAIPQKGVVPLPLNRAEIGL